MGALGLRGASGSYASLPDTNLLDADTAHLQQSKASWRNQQNTDGGVQTADSESGFGSYVLRVTCDGVGAPIINTGAAGIAVFKVSPNTQYSASVLINSSADRDFTVTMQWWSSVPGYLSQAVGSAVTCAANTPTRVSVTGTSHASADRVVVLVSGVGTPTNGDTFDVSAAVVRAGSDATFVPSLRIVGDLEMEASGRLHDATPAANNRIGWTRVSNDGYGFRIGTTGSIDVFYGDGVSSRAGVSSAAVLSDNTDAVLKATFDQSAGRWDYYKDGASFDNDTGLATNSGTYLAGTDLVIGGGASEQLSGNLNYFIVRDGIGGPAVATVDFRNLTPAELEAASFTTDEGHTVTLSGSEWAYVKEITSGILSRAEAVWMAGDGTQQKAPLVADRSGNGHHAQYGSGTGADTNDPTFLNYSGKGKHAVLDGVASNYASTPDVNLLDADTAHLAQSVGQWVVGGTFGAGSAYESAGGGFGALRLIAGSASSFANWTASGSWAVTGNPSLSVDVTAEQAGDIRLRVVHGGGTTDQVIAVTQGFQRIGHTFTSITSPITSISLRLSSDALNDEYAFSKIRLSDDSDTTFVPSLRIVGDIDVRAKVAADDYTPAGVQGIVNKFLTTGNQRSYNMNIQPAGAVQLVITEDGTTQISGSVSASLTDGTAYELRMTSVESTGTVTLYVDGAQEGTVATGRTAPIYNGSSQLVVGSRYDTNGDPFDGEVYWAEIRDGIDGPVVARFDAADWSEPFATATGTTGRTWTANRSASGQVLTFVDRDAWLFTTDDYLVVPDDTALDFNTSDDLTVVSVVRPSLASAQRAIISKQASISSSAGYTIYSQVGDEYRFLIADGTVLPFDSNTTDYAVQSLAIVAGRRDATANEVEVFVGGAGTGTPTTDTTTATHANSNDLHIGSATTPVNWWEGEILAAAVFREALTDDEIVRAGNALAGAATSGALWGYPIAVKGMMLETG